MDEDERSRHGEVKVVKFDSLDMDSTSVRSHDALYVP